MVSRGEKAHIQIHLWINAGVCVDDTRSQAASRVPSQTDWTLGWGEAALLWGTENAQVQPALTAHTLHFTIGRFLLGFSFSVCGVLM